MMKGRSSPVSFRTSSAARGAETRHAVVGDHDVPGAGREHGLHVFRGLDTLVLHVVAPLAHLAHEKQRIVFGILDDQHAQRRRETVQSLGRFRRAQHFAHLCGESFGVKGFWRNGVPASRTPWWTIALSV